MASVELKPSLAQQRLAPDASPHAASPSHRLDAARAGEANRLGACRLISKMETMYAT